MSANQSESRSGRQGHIPRFEKSFLLPKYWGLWLGIGILFCLAYIPASIRNPLLSGLGRWLGKKIKRARHRARVNLVSCFPELSDEQRENIIDEMFATVLPTLLMVVQLGVRGVDSFNRNIKWHGREILDAHIQNKDKIILLVPHAWGIDIPGVVLAHEGYPIAAMFHHQRNKLIDYLWNKVRLSNGGRIHAREDGIKPLISSIRDGYLGYYLPDEDHGPEQSEFVDFFATYKATLPAVGRLMKLCRAKVIPLFPRYDYQTSTLHIDIRPAMNDLSEGDNVYIARRMNEEVEAFVRPYPEQYTWVLELLETRKPEDPFLY